jgi:hypothetical protein
MCIIKNLSIKMYVVSAEGEMSPSPQYRENPLYELHAKRADETHNPCKIMSFVV